MAGENHRRGQGGSSSGTPSGNIQPSSRDDTYTVTEAAKVLGLTSRRVRTLAQEGRIEGERTEGGWKLFRWAVHSFRDERRALARERSSSSEASESPVEPREARERVEALQRELGRLEGRLEIEAVARSTLEESLQRERDRADRLEAELAESRKGFWRRLFGA